MSRVNDHEPQIGRASYILAAAFPASVFVKLLLGAVNANAEELRNYGDLNLTAVILSAVVLWLALATVLAWSKLNAIGRIVWCLLSGYAVFLLVRDLLFPFTPGALAGGLVTPPGRLYVALEALVFVVASLGILKLPRRTVFRIATVFGVVFLASACFEAAVYFSQPERAQRSISVLHSLDSETTSRTDADPDKPDIVHIVFDGYQTILFDEVCRLRADVAPFDDFILFEKNISNYPATEWSLLSLFSSSFCPPDRNYESWREAQREQSFTRTLKEHGYRTIAFGVRDLVAPVDYALNTLNERDCQELYRDATTGEDPVDTIRSNALRHLVTLRLLPSAVGAQLYNRVLSQGSDVAPPIDHWPYYSVLAFRHMTRQLSDLPPGGNYVFMHVMCPHGPNVYDREGHYLPGVDLTVLDQAFFCHKLMSELIEQLKRQGRYRETLIVVHGDHGLDIEEYRGQESGLRLSDRLVQMLIGGTQFRWQKHGWTPQDIRVNSDALLLVKPPGHRGFERRSVPTQLLDIGPTILEAVGIHDHGRQGLNLLSDDVPADRERPFFVYPMGEANTRPEWMQTYWIQGASIRPGAKWTFNY